MKFNDGVSIIVTVFNKEKYIENTLSSIVKQMNRSSELIIVNDGSTDKSLQKINAFFKKRKISHKLINQTNTGPSIAINNALKKVKFSCVNLSYYLLIMILYLSREEVIVLILQINH